LSSRYYCGEVILVEIIAAVHRLSEGKSIKLRMSLRLNRVKLVQGWRYFAGKLKDNDRSPPRCEIKCAYIMGLCEPVSRPDSSLAAKRRGIMQIVIRARNGSNLATMDKNETSRSIGYSGHVISHQVIKWRVVSHGNASFPPLSSPRLTLFTVSIVFVVFVMRDS
jgi:hypothetical protein